MRIYNDQIFGISDTIENLRSKENGVEIDPQYFTDVKFEDAISLYGFDVNDFMIYDTIIPSHSKDSYLREVIPMEWSIWKNPHYEFYEDFEKTARGFRVLHSSTIAKLTNHFKPPNEGTYKILLGFGSTVGSIIDEGILRVGYIRLNGGGVDLTGYVNDIAFDLESESAAAMYKLASPEFIVSNDKEIIIATWSKTSNEGSGYLYILPFILKRVI